MSNQNKQKRSLSDIRAVIAMVIGLIAIFLIVASLFVGNAPDELAKTGGLNANLYAGIGLGAIALGMGLWWFAVPEGAPGEEDAPDATIQPEGNSGSVRND